MATGTLFDPHVQSISGTGAPHSGAKLFFYLTTTTTTFTVYQDALLSTPHANPVVAGTDGLFAPIYIAGTIPFKTVLKTSADVVIQTADPVPVVPAFMLNYQSDQAGLNTVGGTGNAITLTTAQTLTAYGTGDQQITSGNRLAFKPPATNTAAVTLAVNSLAAKAIRKIVGGVDVAVAAGDLLNARLVEVVYDAGANASAGGWILLNSALTQTYQTGHLFGMTLSNNVADATNDIDIAVGTARDSTDAANMNLSTALTKQLDVGWAAGTNAGGLDQGSIANATYHVHAIERVDTAATDIIFSLSHDKAATITMTIASPAVVTMGSAGAGHGLVAGSPIKFATTIALPTGVVAGTQYYVIAAGLTETAFEFSTSNGGAAVNTTGTQSGVQTCLPGPQLSGTYTVFRRIGSIVRSGGSIKAFKQVGDNFTWLVPISDIAANNPGSSAVTATLTVPVGIMVGAAVFWAILDNTPATVTAGLLTPLIITDTAPTSPLLNINMPAFGAGIAARIGTVMEVLTNTSAQVRYRLSGSNADIEADITTFGWRDTRGRLF